MQCTTTQGDLAVILNERFRRLSTKRLAAGSRQRGNQPSALIAKLPDEPLRMRLKSHSLDGDSGKTEIRPE